MNEALNVLKTNLYMEYGDKIDRRIREAIHADTGKVYVGDCSVYVLNILCYKEELDYVLMIDVKRTLDEFYLYYFCSHGISKIKKMRGFDEYIDF